jgi:type IV pilus assembly protein PilB
MNGLMKKNLGAMLLEANLIDEIQMQIALEVQKKTGRRFGSTLVDLKFVDENVLAAFLSKQVDIPCISLLNIAIPDRTLARVPPDMARRLQAIPVKEEANILYVAMADPTDINAVTEMEEASGISVSPLIAPQSSIAKVIKKLYDRGSLEDTHPSLKDISMVMEEMDPAEAFQQIRERLDALERTLAEIRQLLRECLPSPRK